MNTVKMKKLPFIPTKTIPMVKAKRKMNQLELRRQEVLDRIEKIEKRLLVLEKSPLVNSLEIRMLQAEQGKLLKNHPKSVL